MKYSFTRLVQVSLLAASLSSCDRKPAASDGTRRPIIAVTLFPMQSLVGQLTGDWADVQSLIPPGTNPHDFKIGKSQMVLLSRADLLIVIGANLDGWAETGAVNARPSGLQIERMADLIGPGETEAAQPGRVPNQHLWMDPIRTVRFVKALAPVLEKKYPTHAAEIEQRKEKLVAELEGMDKQFRKDLAAVPEKRIIAYHNAYDLLAERYGLVVVAHLTDIDLAPGGEVKAHDLVETIEAVKRYHLKVIYSEPQFPAKAVEQVHDEAGAKVLSLDDVGGPDRPGYDSYQALLRSDVKILVEGQSISN